MLGVFGLIGGIGYVLLVIGFLRGKQKHPSFYGGSFLALTGYTAWAVWFGILIIS